MPAVPSAVEKGAMTMWDILWALLFMALGGAIVHVSWLHAWRMYRNGKAEGQGNAQKSQQSRGLR